jgi:prephenate dehydrogenase
MAEVVAWLRREKETLEVQRSLAEQEAARWRGQAAHAERSAAEAREVRCSAVIVSVPWRMLQQQAEAVA